MSTHQTNLETLQDKDKDSQEPRNIEPEGTSIDSSSSSKENHNDNDISNSIGPNGSSRQVDAFRRSERITKLKNSVSVSSGNTQAAALKGKGGKIEPSTKSKPPPKAKARAAAPKAHAANPPPKTKTKATSKPKRNTTKKRKTVAPEPEAPPAIEEILPFLEERCHLYDAVEYFKDRLERIHISLDKEADSPSRSVSHDVMLMKAFENEMESLVEYEFPMVLKGLRGLAQAVMGHPDSEEPRLEENDAGDGQSEEESGKTESREPVKKTLTQSLYKKRPRGDDDNDAEEDGRYHPRQKVALQNESGQGEASTPTSGKRQREAALAGPDNDNDHRYRDSKRSQRFWKGKGKATTTHASNVNSPSQIVHQANGVETSEGATPADIDEEKEKEIRSESTSRGPKPQQTSSTQPTASSSGSRSPGPSTSYPPDRPVINIVRRTPH